MKKLLVICTLLYSSLNFAQHEVKLDLMDAVALRTVEFSYEYYLTKANTVGLSTLFNLVDQNSDFRYNENTMITPYFRHYFTTEAKWNFFGEVFVGVNSGKKESVSKSGDYDLNYTDAALGIAAGLKYISGDGLTIGGHVGLGRNLITDNAPVLVPRIGLNIGWQF